MGTGKLKVFITDINNKDPIIRPNFASVTISENTPIDRSIHQVSATDADDKSVLRYSFIATSATDGNGAQVNFNNFDYRNLFRMDDVTGNVFVNSALDRDRAASITFDLVVQDTAATPRQTGTGVLLIHVTEYNDQPPQFNSTQYNIVIKEELNINSFIQNLYCTDEDDKIDGYSLVQDEPRRPNFFSFYATSGAMLVENRIDYDRPNFIEKIELTAFCRDTGSPQLTASTKVTVTVLNINDNYPVFEQRLYRKTISEGNVTGPLGLSIKATDLDSGDYGVLKYRLLNSSKEYDRFFSINEDTAEITISPDAVFDREVTGFLGIQVEAYDSPLDPSQRLRSSVPVYISIQDVNDNCPVFRERFYTGTVPESSEEDTSIIDIIATDKDEGINAEIVYAIKPNSGNPSRSVNMFSVGARNGRILVRSLLRGLTGVYNFNVTATDMRGANSPMACTVEIPVSITVQESLNKAPVWKRPPRKGFVIYVLESQYEGMLVYSAKATDDNVGENGVIDYYILDKDELKDRTAEFRINRVTGVIRAEVEFDREEKDTYFLTLRAKDRGNPSASSDTTLTVVILDVDDNDPKFPTKDGQVIPLVLPGPGEEPVNDGEALPNKRVLGHCNATDADSDHENNRIFYEIL
ncbi:cadherin-87A, partial [Elysia marginata]